MKPLLKILLIGGTLLLLAVPVMMLQGLVWERQQRGYQVAEDIAQSSSRAQEVIGPLLRVQIERQVRQVRMFEDSKGKRSEEEVVTQTDVVLVGPTALRIDGDLATEVRRRGIFEALVYLARMRIDAEFAPYALPEPAADVVSQRIVHAAFVLGVGDARGIRGLQASLGPDKLVAEPGTAVSWLPAGVMLPIDAARLALPAKLGLQLDLAGTQSLHWVPSGDETQVSLRSAWAHPSFTGQFLPDAPKVSEAGFDAQWRVSRLATQTQEGLRACGGGVNECPTVSQAVFGVKLVDPVDRYLKTDRAIKYAWLFIVLVFGAVFFLELLRPGVRVHPLQYGLTGLALAIFFLLLLSLSEHIGFGPAYLVAAAACVSLVTIYLATPLGGRGRAAGFGGLLAALYGLLYGLLQSEDYALLMGALALFALLATAMLLTRRLDWYGLATPTT
jgi:inner membrane protein